MVSVSNSGSIMTRQAYKVSFELFCDFIGKTGKQIFDEYEQLIKAALPDIAFKRKYAQYINSWAAFLEKKELSPNSIGTRVGAVKSFFKYNDLPLAYIPKIKLRVLYHNRDITRDEIRLILETSRPRERAFFAIMAQSGLRPNTICNLKYENIKEDLENNKIPCKIEIPQEIAKGKYHSYFTFIGKEAIKYLKSYLVIRPKINDEDYLFLSEGTQQKANPKSISALFGRTVKNLKEKGKMKLKQEKENKPHDIRLYSLRKWFRKYANQAGFENVHFWMGHTVKTGQEKHYRPTNVEFYRKKYAKEAMPHLRLEKPTPSKTEETINTIKQENRELKDQIENLEFTMQKIYQKVFHEEIEQKRNEKWLEEHSEELEEQDKIIEKHYRKQEEYLKKHPRERKRQEEEKKKRDEQFMKYLEEHSKEIEEQDKMIEEYWILRDGYKKAIKEIQDIIKKKPRKQKNN